MHRFVQSQIHYLKTLPAPSQVAANGLLIFDRQIYQKNPKVRSWIDKWSYKYGVNAGERLKDLDFFAEHMKQILKKIDGISHKDLTIVCIGGGSVGDFSGFVASTLKRGLRFMQIPSTWLAAIDSSHGGKTALNVGHAKNQIGTFYPAQDIFIVESLLSAQPASLTVDGLAELTKIAFLDRKPWTKTFLSSSLKNQKLIFRFLKPGIQAKWDVVNKDPFEQTGHRRILNLGHSLGHILELHHGLSHGKSVALGLHFSLLWSHKLGLLKDSEFNRLKMFLDKQLPVEMILKQRKLPPLSKAQFLKLASKDKKASLHKKFYFIINSITFNIIYNVKYKYKK